jgi:predicted RNase H-like nuclease (RuvC/YqgF family)
MAFMSKRELFARSMRCNVLHIRTKLQGVIVGLVLVVFLTSDLLLRAGNIETNPGPDSKDSGRTVQTRLTSAGGRTGTTERRNSNAAASDSPSLSDVMSKLMSMDSSMQAMNMSMNSKMDQVKDEIQQMRSEVGMLQKEVESSKERIDALEVENDELRLANEELLTRVSKMEKQTDDLESRSRRNNVLFYGLDREEGESQETLEQRLNDLCTDKLELSETVEFDRVHRVSGKQNSPVIARCTFYKDKIKLMKAKLKLKGSNIFIGEDFSRGVRDIRKKLGRFAKEKKEGGETVKMIYDHLVVNGKKLFLSEDGLGLVEK